MKNYIKGNFRKNIFSSDKGYIIGLFKVRETNDPEMDEFVNKTITFTGYFNNLNQDDMYLFYGELIDNKKYGLQYQVTEYERIKPEDKDGIIAFLSSDLFQGVGEAMAGKIVDYLGLDALDKILDDKNNLLSIPKMTMLKANKIYDTLKKYEDSHQNIVFLGELGFNMRDALCIYNVYRDNTQNIIENNIYQVLDDVKDILFTKIDEIAINLNYEQNDARRIKALILFVMDKTVISSGNTYLEYLEIYSEVNKYLNDILDENTFENYISELVDNEKIYIENNRYYSFNIYKEEVYIASRFKTLNDIDNNKIRDLDMMIDNQAKANNIIYNDDQKKAIKKALTNNMLIITGGPGTGKTTIIKAIVNIYQNIYHLDYEQLANQVSLIAPTGRASKRIGEATNLSASTIHRFLKWNKETNQFAVNEFNKNDAELIIVDEASMIDIHLLYNLLKGLNNDIQLVLVGDYNQLPSVGPGQILKDLIDSDVIDTVTLNHLYRQDENSYIVQLASEIKNNQLSDYLAIKSDYTFLQCNSASIKDNLKKVCEQINAKGYDYKSVQIMAPMYAGINGIDNLNMELQQVFNPSDPIKLETTFGNVTYREGDKILQLVNMPEENIFNGDIGIIQKIIKSTVSDSGKNEIYVDYDGTLIKYLPKDFIKIIHGYVISIHKSQGSEFDIVVIPVTKAYNKMLYRKLIYTGITRAKKKLILIGESEALVYAVANDSNYERKSSLMERLISIHQ